MKKFSSLLMLIMLFMLSGYGNSGNESGMSASNTSRVPVSQSSNIPAPASASEVMSPSQLPESQIPSSQSTPNADSYPAPENVDEAYLTGLGDLVGTILDIHPEGFSLEGGVPQLSANRAYAEGGNELTADILYTDQTIFLLAEYHVATDESTVCTGSIEDVAQGRSVAVWGKYEGGNFVATAVRVVVFSL